MPRSCVFKIGRFTNIRQTFWSLFRTSIESACVLEQEAITKEILTTPLLSEGRGPSLKSITAAKKNHGRAQDDRVLLDEFYFELNCAILWLGSEDGNCLCQTALELRSVDAVNQKTRRASNARGNPFNLGFNKIDDGSTIERASTDLRTASGRPIFLIIF